MCSNRCILFTVLMIFESTSYAADARASKDSMTIQTEKTKEQEQKKESQSLNLQSSMNRPWYTCCEKCYLRAVRAKL